ncbi:MAG TPA: long-chain fatty acid--CoA ligase [Actinomycetota bacterium]|nr:long-chain fatty acid--CoA ligase [Actinomycetota bacterium]
MGDGASTGSRMRARTIVERFRQRVDRHPERVALRHRRGDGWIDVTWADYGDAVARAAGGLLDMGFRPGDRACVLARNRPEWHFADVAAMSAGGAVAPIYTSSAPAQVVYVARHSRAKVAFVDDAAAAAALLDARADLPHLERVVLFDGPAGDDALVTTWDDLLAAGDGVPRARVDDAAPAPGDVATIVYTAGTTGPPKGVVLTHANVWWTCTHSEEHIPISDAESARALSYLPLAHIAERMISHFLQIYYGTQTWFARSFDTVDEDLLECRPTYFFGVPRVWEKFHDALRAKIDVRDPSDRKMQLVPRALGLGAQIVEAEQDAVRLGGLLADARVPLKTRVEHAFLDRLALHELRAALGLDECRLAVSGAAPINPDVVRFFHSIGIKIAEGYGQSEGCGPTTWNPPDAVRIGTVGTALPGVELTTAEDDEILVRGGNVTPGYLDDDDATAALIDSEGWMHTGDLGHLDEHGYLRITGRKKDLIVTAAGKNVAPQEIEGRIEALPLVTQAVVVGDGRPFLCALVTLDDDHARAWAAEQGIDGDLPAIVGHERTLKEIEAGIEDVNRGLAGPERVKKVRVLERGFLETADEVTPTQRVRRARVHEAYAGVLEELYGDSPAIAPAAGAD